MTRVMNFNAGPATLPTEALERARDELLDFQGTGMSVMEHSHRGKEYEAVHAEAKALLREHLRLPDTHELLFLQGGASTQFALVPLNLLPRGRVAEYVLTGVWGEKALAEAQTIAAIGGGEAQRSQSSAEPPYTRVPHELHARPDAAYVHVTSNETIHGVQFTGELPHTQAPLVVDMSSDFLWRPMDLSRTALVYAGAQKNIGPSGLAVVVVRKDIVEAGRRDIPKIFQYRVAAANDSLYNTPPTFGIYLIRNVLAWTRSIGGLPEIERRNRAKAATIYGAIDGSAGFYRCPVEPAARSFMNVVFRLPSEALEERFVKEAKAQRMVGLKGHRSVGGIRVSLYNAVPPAWADALAQFMADFARRNG